MIFVVLEASDSRGNGGAMPVLKPHILLIIVNNGGWDSFSLDLQYSMHVAPTASFSTSFTHT